MPEQENPMFTPQRRYFRLDRRDLAYLTFIVEAYDGVATLSTVDRRETLVSLTTLPCRAAELDSLIEALRKEIPMTETTPAFNHHLPEEDGEMNPLSQRERDRVRAPGGSHARQP